MNIELGFNRQLRKLGILLSIPATILISLLVIRFINQSGPGSVNAPGALLPNNKIELQSNQPNSISQLTGELEQNQEAERSGHKLVSLDFPGNIANSNKSLTHSNSYQTHTSSNNKENRTSDLHESPLTESADPESPGPSTGNSQRRQGIYPALTGSSHSQKAKSGFAAIKPLQEGRFSGLVSSTGKQNDLIQESNIKSDQKLTPAAAGFNGFSKAESRNSPGIFTDNNAGSIAGQETVNLQIKAFALGDQKIHQGSVVKFRTMAEYSVNGKRILQNTIFYAFASFENDRLKLYVHKIKANYSTVSLHFVCLDDDDKEGIAMITIRNKWAETAETGKNSAVDEVSSRIPVASGMLSQVGHKLFSANRNEEYLIADGLELSFKQRTD